LLCILESITNEIKGFDKEIEKADEVSYHQQAASQEINNATLSLTSLTTKIQELAFKV